MPLLGEGAGSPCNTMRPGPKPTFMPRGILIHPAVWSQQTWAENWGREAVPLFWGGGAGSPSSTMWPGPRPTSVPSGILNLDPCSRLAKIDIVLKLGGGALPPFWGKGAGSPSNTMSLGFRPTFLPSSMLIHRSIWPQQIWTENWGLCPLGEGDLGPI